jgi:DNA-binding response OmpR family regulator
MPIMNGLEATAAIRAQERLTGTHVPIIAMTAHTMKGDQERCLAAGMDAYVAKPLKRTDLDAALEQVLGPQAVSPLSPADAPIELASAMHTVDGNQTLFFARPAKKTKPKPH